MYLNNTKIPTLFYTIILAKQNNKTKQKVVSFYQELIRKHLFWRCVGDHIGGYTYSKIQQYHCSAYILREHTLEPVHREVIAKWW